jgi:hypothetical protein
MLLYFLKRNAGFFSEIFFMINYCLIAYRHSVPFKINTSNWLFKYKEGWHDYFDSLSEYDNTTPYCLAPQNIPEEINFCENIDFTMQDYKTVMKDLFKLNSNIQTIYNTTVSKLDLLDYHSIFIRRGDKMIEESIFIPTSKYIDKLFELNDAIKTIFIQTDDYNVYLEAIDYINSLKLDIRVVTTCPENKRGVHMFSVNTSGSSVSEQNDHYIKTQDRNTKPIANYTNEEVYNHTIEMLVGLEICKHSNYLILDLQSNVSRYLLLTHDNNENVIDLQNTVLDFNKPVFCPTIGIKYKD